jgi:hypothetical protein
MTLTNSKQAIDGKNTHMNANFSLHQTKTGSESALVHVMQKIGTLHPDSVRSRNPQEASDIRHGINARQGAKEHSQRGYWSYVSRSD